MLVEEIDAVGLQSLQRLVCDDPDALGAAVKQAGTRITVLPTEFGRDHDLITERSNRLAQHFLILNAVSLGGIKEGHAQVMGAADQGDSVAALSGSSIAERQPHAAEA